jgi:hypothetical protein
MRRRSLFGDDRHDARREHREHALERVEPDPRVASREAIGAKRQDRAHHVLVQGTP